MNEQEKFDRVLRKHPHDRAPFFARPSVSRRRFFQLAGAGVSGAWLANRLAAADSTSSGIVTRNTAKNVIFILLAGAPSQTDTFDYKGGNVAPASFAPETIGGVVWPTGLMPKLGKQLSDFSIIRSLRSHALVHSLSQTWVQIGRNPTGVGSIAPNIGSVIAIEKDSERLTGQVFPTFVALNSTGASGPGYFQAKYGPFKSVPGAGGVPDSTSPVGATRFTARWNLLHSLDDSLRVHSPNGKPFEDYGDFYNSAQGIMSSPTVNQAFGVPGSDSVRYGSSSLGDACLVAAQIVRAQQGTRYIEITSNEGWDMHTAIYSPDQLPGKGKILDDAVSALLNDLKSSGMLSSTLVVMMGEFGRTVGPLTGTGRDHYPMHFAFVSGGGTKGGRILGATDSGGVDAVDYGWSRQRYVYMEDIEATIYSAIGIDWTTVRHDDPLHRGFEYVPFSSEDLYGPVNELWT